MEVCILEQGKSISDPTVYDCCKKLAKIGWMDGIVADTMLKFNKKKTVQLEDDEKKILELFGYV